MASLGRKTCRLFGCCHIKKRETKFSQDLIWSLSSRKRYFHETTGEVKDKSRTQRQDNVLLDLIKYNNDLVSSSDPFYMMNHLLKNKLFENEHIVAFNKPAGFPMTYNPPKNIRNCDLVDRVVNLDGLLPELAERLLCTKLYVALPIDRMCSGVLILTKSEDYKEFLQKRFNSLKTTNQYLYQHWDALCVGVPDKLPAEKVKLYYNKEKFRDIYLPQTVFCTPSMNTRKRGNVMYTSLSGEIITKNEERGARSSHVRVSVTSASNHVIPAFLSESFAPILGDQEYFWRAVSVMGVKMSILKQIPSSGIPRPQELSKGILHNLGIKQGHVQNLPVFLHRYAVDIVFLKNDHQENFQIKAPLPDTFLLAKYKLLKDNQSEAECMERFAGGHRLKYNPSEEGGTTDGELGLKEWEKNIITDTSTKDS
ncbi:pseudouridylate synthase RPUSD4, mitochondrial [Magallana gigas]|uniref:pseudouridylate synthase RPUSD4, mitochondrial n=1 Tax=Magallana gigas TaxID=29159 RepID=UPI00333F20AA